ncbi:hypothetical protein [Microbacterium esteraromaticum]|uniref:hypothetical protein n=1 Tax=Microbacterium esteraromaticum TaxID=57043 RepID=UPI001C96AF5C|nr:hypothetical protein [Microbacterium esteraromaticum]MBY6060722.1 hypothetical protein [Microbacterium esteraromaticum]
MTDQPSVSDVRAALQRSTPATASATDIEAAVFAAAGQRDLANDLIRESYQLCHRARGRVKEVLREHYGPRAPRSGAITILILILLFAATAPLGLLNAYRLDTVASTLPAAVAAAVVGAALLVAVLATGLRPVAQNVVLQMSLAFGLLAVATGIGVATSTGTALLLFLLGGGLALISLILMLIGRARDREATIRMDTAYRSAYLEVAPEVAAERERLITGLPARLTSRGADIAALRALRSSAIESFAAEGNPTSDSAPESVPGAYLVDLETQRWLPAPQRADSAAQ